MGRRQELPWPLYAVVLAGFGSLILVTSLTTLNDWRGMLFFGVMGAAAEWMYIPLRRGMLSLTFSVVLSVFALYGAVAAAWVNVVSNIVGNGFLRRRPWPVALFNAGQYSLAALGAGLACQALFGLSPGGFDEWPVHFQVSGLALYVVLYFLLNQFLVRLYFSLDGHRGKFSWDMLADETVDVLRWDALSYLFTVPMGVLLAWAYIERGFPGATVAFIPVLGSAWILRLHVNLSLATRELAILYDVAQQMGPVLEPERLFRVITDGIRKVAGYDACGLYLWDEQAGSFYAAMGEPASVLLPEHRIKAGQGIVGRVGKSGQPEIVNELPYGMQGGLLPAGFPPVGSLMVVPLVVEDRLVGVIAVGHRQPYTFAPKHLSILTVMASQAAVAIENAILYRRTEELAATDPMTGLYNYRYFYQKLEEELRKARSERNEVSLIYLDLNDFKQYNDRFGHQTGDLIIKEFADIVRRNVREGDTPVRYAGDEFVVLLPRTGVTEAVLVADRICRAVAAHAFRVGDQGEDVSISVSAGVASYPEHALSETELIHLADQAMYRGKRDDRSESRIFLPREKAT